MKDEELITTAFTQLETRTGYTWKWHPVGNDLDGIVDLYLDHGKEPFIIEVKTNYGNSTCWRSCRYLICVVSL